MRAEPSSGRDQRPDHALESIAAVEGRQVTAVPGVRACSRSSPTGQFTLGPERLGAARGRGQPGQLALAEVEPPGDRQIPSRACRRSCVGPRGRPSYGLALW